MKPLRLQKSSGSPASTLLPESWNFIVLGDTQRTSFLEWFFLRRERNELRSGQLIDHIARAQPRIVVIVGDLIGAGSSVLREWNYFHALTRPLIKAQIPILPAVGNHDRHIQDQFHFENDCTWYKRVIGRAGLIWLDTTLRLEAQVKWFEDNIASFESDDQVDHIVVFAHHPPFTKSTLVGPSKYVQSNFLDAFLSAQKTRFFISGHHHGYEAFELGSKLFIVTGGGGGPRPKVNRVPFHFLKITISTNAQVEIFGLEEDTRLLKPMKFYASLIPIVLFFFMELFSFQAKAGVFNGTGFYSNEKIVKRSKITKLEWIGGAVIGTAPVVWAFIPPGGELASLPVFGVFLPEFGLGQLAQGRFLETGWIVTVGEGLTFGLLNAAYYNGAQDSELLIAMAFLSFRAYELYDVWVGPIKHNTKLEKILVSVAPMAKNGAMIKFGFRF
jgi:Icc-related predicted phosphoesterase